MDTALGDLDNRPVKWKNKFHEKSLGTKKADALLSVSQFTANKTNETFK
jgi:hypothetical protein